MVRLTDRPDMTLDVYRGRKTNIQQTKSLVNKTFKGLGSIRGYFGLNILGKLNTLV